MKLSLPNTRTIALPPVLGLLAAGALAGATAAEAGPSSCIVPNAVGVNLAMARQALTASGCAVELRQLPPHGQFVTPAGPDSRQLVAAQSPSPGSRAARVTLSLQPLCAQPASPGPDVRGPVSSSGSTELVAGLFVQGGPIRTAARCRRGVSAAGTLTVSTVYGRVVLRHTVRAGRFAVFPLKPGRYVISGSVASASNTAAQAQQETVTIAPKHTTRLNLVAVPG
jgi:hypothetical protein